MIYRMGAALCVAITCIGCSGSSGPESPAVAKWVTERGGVVHIAGRNVPLRKPADVPEDEFRIEEIDLADRPVKNEDLEQLSKLTYLKELRLYGTDIGDKGLQHLSGIKGLAELELSRTRITDEGLKSLSALQDLKKLYVYNTAVTKKAVDALKEQRPGLTIYHDAR